MCKPIYDWTEDDVFLYFYRNRIKYCHIYDLQLFNGDNLRVSTPLHAEASKRIDKLQTLYPIFYSQLVELFPDVLLQARYYKELKPADNIFDNYPPTIDGIIQYAKDTIKDRKQLELAIACVRQAAGRRQEDGDTHGGYPLRYIAMQIRNGSYKRGRFIPVDKLTKLDMEIERRHIEWISSLRK